MSDTQETTQAYQFPWAFHLGSLRKDSKTMPLFTPSNDGGFCLLYDKISEPKADKLLESLCLELLQQMPHESLKVHMFDYGKKKFYNLSPLTSMQLYNNAYDASLCSNLFDDLEKIIVSRYTDLLCCTRQTIDEHNEKSKMKQMYHLVLINLEVFPTEEISTRRINNFIESAQKAGVYILPFANQTIKENKHENIQAFLKGFKNLEITENEFNISKEVFEFQELLEDHTFESLDLHKPSILQEVLIGADLEKFLDPEAMVLEENTKVQ